MQRGQDETTAATNGLGIAVLRVVTGIVFFMHGWQKFFDTGIDNTEAFFDSQGIILPGLMAPLVATLEVVGGLALIAGVLTRAVAILLASDMLVAALTVHVDAGFFVGDGGYELVLLLGAAAVSLAVMGPGTLSADALLGLDARARGFGIPTATRRRALGSR